MTTACDAHTRAISSSATTYATMSLPLPPHRSGTAMPMSPSSPIRLTVSCGKRASRSISMAIGRISLSANSRAIAWIAACSSVRSNRIYFSRSFLNSFVSSGTTSKRSPTMP